MLNVVYQILGSSCIIGLKGDEEIFDKEERKKNIIERYYMFWNYGATSGDLKWMHDDFAYFWSSPKRFRRSLFNILEMRYARKTGLELEGKSWINKLNKEADEMYENISKENFIKQSEIVMEPFSCGGYDKKVREALEIDFKEFVDLNE